ncbi:hypothetical protein HZQ11_15160 [Elizabethkingia anophelis]|uniref:RiboL-PSP-HEPN domain-containing protein n=3 Tax=Elizabethkingia TaxID=308865 RepID=A0ABD4DQL1_ELIMR|nr:MULTISPECIES: hypothetical protein [Elizabethkingia]AQW95832.1 hypothetical protein BBD30_17445 [Elizabethkingia anophelis]KUF45669.1 hypothetical protein AS358_09755 [Elizabethkingia anophelis]KUY20629.1 hypothetical protein ATB95_06910 [Elizabethkingia miricola]MCL1653182.1 hypothetical protein [Elizabethkingia miricola]MCL1677970.1 hypothetical protein [Elizabethkingia miricola]
MLNRFRLGIAKKKVIKAIDENISTTESSIKEFSKLLSDFKKHNYHRHNSFFNLCIFSDIAGMDLIILLEKIRIADRPYEKKLYARVIAVIIIDFLDNINLLLGRDCLNELKDNNMTEFIDKFKTINKNFSNFKKHNEKILRDIRNNTIAHKSKDALTLNEKINNLNVEDVYEFGLEFQNHVKGFIDLSTEIVYYILDYMREGRKL